MLNEVAVLLPGAAGLAFTFRNRLAAGEGIGGAAVIPRAGLGPAARPTPDAVPHRRAIAQRAVLRGGVGPSLRLLTSRRGRRLGTVALQSRLRTLLHRDWPLYARTARRTGLVQRYGVDVGRGRGCLALPALARDADG